MRKSKAPEPITLTKGVITRDEALKLCPDYVAFVEQHTLSDGILDPFMWNYDVTDKHGAATSGIKVGQQAITCHDGQYVRVKVTSIQQQAHHESDGPTVRVSNGEYSWRVDGDKYAYLLKSTQDLRLATKTLPADLSV